MPRARGKRAAGGCRVWGWTVVLFLSSSPADAEAVAALVRRLEAEGRTVQRGGEISGGQAWWTAALAQIRECDVFVFAVSRDALDSEPCMLELGYAEALGLPVLVVEVADATAEPRRGHPSLTEDPVDYRVASPENDDALLEALRAREAARGPLPDPLPAEPRMPFEYILRFDYVIRSPEPIPEGEQRELVSEFRAALARVSNEPIRAGIRGMLIDLKARSDVGPRVVAEIDELLARNPPRSIVAPAAVAPRAAGEREARAAGPARTSSYGHVRTTASGPARTVDIAPHFARPAAKPSRRRTIGIVLGAVAGGLVLVAMVVAIGLLWSRGDAPSAQSGGEETSSATSTPTPTPPTLPTGPVECWNGPTAAGIAECTAFSGTAALQFAFYPDSAPGGTPVECVAGDQAREPGQAALVFCRWRDLPGVVVRLAEWQMTSDEVIAHWDELLEWDDVYEWVDADQQAIGQTWEVQTVTEGANVWMWAGAFEALPMSFDIISDSRQGGTPSGVQAAWERLNPLRASEIAILPAVG